MLHDPDVVLAVAAASRRYGGANGVRAAGRVATGGDARSAHESVAVLVRELFPLATVVTPNLDEAALLLGRPVTQEAELAQAAADLLALGAPAMLLKGGHLAGEELVDLLLEAGRPPQRYASARIASSNTHGTGCTLSSAIACHLAMGHDLAEAVRLARAYVVEAIRHGADVRVGGGHGPLNHGFAPVALRKA
jgi:hydroxymethylpyrimidine/phosphomethylpyrimidine kinase